MILPVAWALYGLLLVFGIRAILGSIINDLPYPFNDKPIGGSVLPLLFFNVTAILGIVLLSLYSVGYWKPSLSSAKSRIELGSVGILLLSGFMLWYSPIFLFTSIASIVVLMALNIE